MSIRGIAKRHDHLNLSVRQISRMKSPLAKAIGIAMCVLATVKPFAWSIRLWLSDGSVRQISAQPSGHGTTTPTKMLLWGRMAAI